MPAILGQCCYVMAVQNVTTTAAHFIDVLGFQNLDIPAPGWRFVQRGPARFDMGECIGTPDAATLGDHSWIARIFVDDIDAYYTEIAPRGANATPPHTKPWGLREMMVITPDGHRLQFCQDMKG